LQVRTLGCRMYAGSCIQVHFEVGLLAARLADGCWMQQRDETVKQPTWFEQLSQVCIRYWEQLNVKGTNCRESYKI